MSKFAIAPDPRLSFTYIELAHPAGSLSQDGGQTSSRFRVEETTTTKHSSSVLLLLYRSQQIIRFVPSNNYHRDNNAFSFSFILIYTKFYQRNNYQRNLDKREDVPSSRDNIISRMIIKKRRVPARRDRRVRFKVVS